MAKMNKPLNNFWPSLFIFLIAFAPTAYASNQMHIHIPEQKPVSLLNETKVTDIAQNERLDIEHKEGRQRIGVKYNTFALTQLRTTANSYSSSYFHNGLNFPSLELEVDIYNRLSVDCSAGWQDEETIVRSPLYGPAMVRSHAVPLSLALQYSLTDRERRLVPVLALGLTDILWVQKSDIQDAQTSESFLFIEPKAQLEWRVLKTLTTTGYVGYLYPIANNSLESGGQSLGFSMAFTL